MSTAKVNTLTGTTSAGSIVVTGEGGSTTTNLQQGLAKAWTHFQGTSTAASVDGYNISSVDDDGTGLFGIHFTSNMSNATYAVTFGFDDDLAGTVVIAGETRNGTMAAGNYDFETYYVNSTTNRTNYDYSNCYQVVHGDLA